ncbi:MAG: hypothetical protein K2G00_08345 [Duncaniella sp.]|nr:hypothetical protein [Bacteroides sp.]MDE6062743.1 hypothetical protein [Duncaniella sp.]
MANIISWDKLMQGALSMPGVNVDRNQFLSSAFHAYGDSNFENVSPTEIYSSAVINKIATGIINNHLTKVTAISTVAGIPGGFAMLGTIPADLAQYYWHYLVMAQKLAYLYGWPDLRDTENNLGEEAQAVMTLFVGIGLGVNQANVVVKELVEQAARHWMKRLPRMALTKTAWYPVIKRIAAFIGVKLTKDGMGKAAGKVIPLLGGLVSGGLTYATFKPMAKKLNKALMENAEIFQKNK